MENYMKSKKTILLMAAFISAVLMFTGCVLGGEETTPEGIRLSSAKFKIYDIPYFATANPTRIPVQEPGPVTTATASNFFTPNSLIRRLTFLSC